MLTFIRRTWFTLTGSSNLTSNNKTYTIQLSRENKLSTIDWSLIESYVTKIFNKRYRIYDFPTNEKANQKAWDLYFDGEIEQALPIFKKILRKDSENALIWNALAICQYELFDYQKALLSINRALEIEEDNKDINLTKASILTEQGGVENDKGKIENALIIYRKLIKNKHYSSTLFYNYASALTKIGDYSNSIPEFEKALSLNPNKPQIWNNLGNAYMNLGIHSFEMLCYDKALLLNPNQPETLFSKGSSLFRYFGKVDKGLELMLKASKKTQRYEYDLPYLYFWIAEAYLEKGNFKEAINWNKKGLNIFSTDKYLLHQHSRIKSKNLD